jgi:hypothetical protein
LSIGIAWDKLRFTPIAILGANAPENGVFFESGRRSRLSHSIREFNAETHTSLVTHECMSLSRALHQASAFPGREFRRPNSRSTNGRGCNVILLPLSERIFLQKIFVTIIICINSTLGTWGTQRFTPLLGENDACSDALPGLDIVIGFTAGALLSSVRHAARLGVVYISHSDGYTQPDFPAGFSEVYFREDASEFSICYGIPYSDKNQVPLQGNVATNFNTCSAKHHYLKKRVTMYFK